MIFEIAHERVVPALSAGAEVEDIRAALLASGLSESDAFLAVRAAETYLKLSAADREAE